MFIFSYLSSSFLSTTSKYDFKKFHQNDLEVKMTFVEILGISKHAIKKPRKVALCTLESF